MILENIKSITVFFYTIHFGTDGHVASKHIFLAPANTYTIQYTIQYNTIQYNTT